jgi:two-component system, OmpR family, sensor histidine kinase MprB
MTFRLRVTLMASLAVAVALVGASIVVYYVYRHDSLSQVDHELGASLGVAPLNQILTVKQTFRPTRRVVTTKDISSSRTFRIVLGGSGSVAEVHQVPVNVAVADISAAAPFHYRTVTVQGVQSRQLTVSAPVSTVTVTRSLADIDRSLSRLRWLLVFTSMGGIAVVATLGALVSGRVVAPLRRLTETTERITETGDLSERTGQRGKDEVSRLSTQLDALFATLEKSQETQRQFVADASHELRTPLATLRANVGLLGHPNGLTGGERAELVADVEEELESMTALVSELVELARGDELDLESKEFRLDQVVQSSLDRAARRTPAVVFRSDLQSTTVHGLPDRVERAVDNLLDNAQKWSPPGAAVDVIVREGMVEVHDRGPGIAAEDVPFVFNRFYRSITARGAPGAGLGLAIVKQVADAHNGSVTVEDAPEGGAILRMSFSASR